MNFVYYCRHCKTFLGSVNDSKASFEQLGLNALTPQERLDMIEYSAVGTTAYVKTVCEYCESALRRQPELMLSQTPLQ